MVVRPAVAQVKAEHAVLVVEVEVAGYRFRVVIGDVHLDTVRQALLQPRQFGQRMRDAAAEPLLRFFEERVEGIERRIADDLDAVFLGFPGRRAGRGGHQRHGVRTAAQVDNAR